MAASVVRILLVCLTLACIAADAAAQEDITPSKRAAIKEMLVAMNAKEVSDSIFDTLLRQYQERVTADLASDYKSWESYRAFTPAQKAKADELIPEFNGKLFARLSDLAKKEIGTPENFEALATPAYAKHFSEAEIRELTAFYLSPLGKKFVMLVPAISDEVMSSFNKLVEAKFMPRAQAIIDEELRELQLQISAVETRSPSRPEPPARRRTRN